LRKKDRACMDCGDGGNNSKICKCFHRLVCGDLYLP
jgi:hypothetical protein